MSSTTKTSNNAPGQIIAGDQPIVINKGKNTIRVWVENSGDRPIQVGSHYHFYETNPALIFDRDQCKGYRLNIIAGTAVPVSYTHLTLPTKA